jgi:hypothetical protein
MGGPASAADGPQGPANDESALTELVRAFYQAREAGDAAAVEAAALGLPSAQHFGSHPGQVPALVHEAYAAAVTEVSRCRLAAAVARAWVYGGEPGRAVRFAGEAVELADRIGDAGVLADALDAALLARWGPDDFAERLRLAARLADTAAHLAEPEARLRAHLWRLTTAWESLDVVAVQRQLRALDVLAQESGSVRVAFYAVSRRAMQALVSADLDAADELIARTSEIGASSAEPDLQAIEHSLRAARARRAGDVAVLAQEAAAFEAYGASEGVAAVLAEAAVLWLHAGEPGRAAALADQLAGPGLGSVPRDVDFLLTTASVVEVAAAAGRADLAAAGARLLEPYAGRAVLNAGAVVFHGVVDDYLYRVGAAESWRDSAAACYRRIGAAWWAGQLERPAGGQAEATSKVIRLHPLATGGWLVGPDDRAVTLQDLKGLTYLRFLLQRPGTDVTAPDLAAAATGHAPGQAPRESSGEVIDARALAAYRARLRDIDAELAEAGNWADEGRLTRLRLEREALLDEVRSAAGLSGRPRRFSTAAERARVAVRKAIAAALDRIADHDPALARLLRDTVRTGAACRYDPDPARPVTWLLDPPQHP